MVKSYNFVYYQPVYENLISQLRDMWPQDIVTAEEYNVVRYSYKQNLSLKDLKFEEEYDELYKTVKLVARMCGLRFTYDDPPLAKFLWEIIYWFFCFNLFIAMSLELTKIIITAGEGSFIDLLTMLPCTGYVILGMVKSYKIVYYRPVYENLISELREMWPRDTVTEEEYNVVRNAYRRTKLIVKGYSCCNAALVGFFVLPPYLIYFRRLSGEDIPLKLGFSYWFPFDPYQYGRFEALLILQTFHCYLTVGFIFIADVLFYVFLSQITTHFDLLAIRIKKLFSVSTDDQLIETYPLAIYFSENIKNDLETSVQKEENVYQDTLVKIITRHRDLIRLSNDVEGQFTFALLLNFINSSVIICFCGFCCVFVESWNEFNYKLFLTTAILQIWSLCWYGQKLLDSSQGVSDAVYESGWYNMPKNIKNSLIIIFYRSQKEVFVTTYGFSVICMESYSRILKTSWSYLMLLINVFN